MFSKQKFAQRIFELRKQHKEKQGDLGEAIGIGRNAVSEIECGRKTTTAEKIALLETAGFRDLTYAQTLTTHPLYSDLNVEDPVPGYDKGDYVAIIAVKPQ